MTEPLDYPGVLAKLQGMLGEQIDLGIRGSDRQPPMVAFMTGILKAGGDLIGGDLVGWDRDALQLYVGELQLTLHPDQFTEASFDGDERSRELTIRFGNLILVIRTGASRS
jgi:hypothetical protein